jgi:hypothetical protein
MFQCIAESWYLVIISYQAPPVVVVTLSREAFTSSVLIITIIDAVLFEELAAIKGDIGGSTLRGVQPCSPY